MHIEFVTPGAKILSGDYDSIVAPGLLGEFEILPGHTTMVSGLGVGVLTLRQGSTMTQFDVEGGVLEVAEDQIKILADACTLVIPQS